MSTTHSKPTQTAEVLAYMEIHGSITPREAMEHFGCYRLAARIFEMRSKGHPIACDKSEGFARYSLKLTPQPA